jgi:hypothetical protein
MTILRRRHNSNFTIVPNSIFEHPDLSIEAKGVLGYLLSRPPDWTIRLTHIGHVLGMGRDKTERIFHELREAGYVLRGEQRRTGGKWGPAEFDVWDDPNLAKARPLEATADPLPEAHDTAAPPCPEKPFTAKPHAVFQGTYKGLKDTKTDSNKIDDDEDDARARAGIRKSMISETAWQVATEIGQEAGYATPQEWPPGWLGAPMRVQGFLDGGYPPEVIKLGALTALRKKRDGPPTAFTYFDKPIAEARARAEAALPKVISIPSQTVEVSNGKWNHHGARTRGSALDAFDQIEAAVDAGLRVPPRPI